MFTAAMQESQERRLVVRGVSRRVFEALLLFLYTGSIDVTPATVTALLDLSHCTHPLLH